MNRLLGKIKTYPLAGGFVCGVFALLLVVAQYNWAFQNNEYGDLPLRITLSIPVGAMIGLLYFNLLLGFLNRLLGQLSPALLRKTALSHIPLLLIALYPMQISEGVNSVLPVLAFGGYFLTLTLLLVLPNEEKIKTNIAAQAPYFLMLIGIAAALGIRIIFIPQPTQDTVNWVMQWLNYIKVKGWSAYADTFTNYSPFYSYLLGIGSLFPLQDLEVIKYISIAFDLMAGIYISKMVRLRYPESRLKPVLALVSYLLLPTILLNSSYWGQCDIIYVAFCMAALYYAMLDDTRRNNFISVLFYALALSVKFQALLMAPLFVIIWLKRNARLTDFLLIPGVYLLLMVPCLIAGRDFMDLLLVYFNIVDKNPILTQNSPNIYQLVGNNFKLFNAAGVLMAVGIQAIIIFSAAYTLKGKKLSMELLVKLAFLITLTMPFFMPRMHERYFILAESAALLYAFYFPRFFYMPVWLGIISLFTYTEFLFMFVLVPFHWLTLAVLVIILIVGWDLLKTLHTKTLAD